MLSFLQSKQGNYPTIDEYIDLLLEQERIICRNRTKYTPKSASQAQSVSNLHVTNPDQHNSKLSKNQIRKLKAKIRTQMANNGQNLDLHQQTSSVNAVQFAQGQGKGSRGRPSSRGRGTRGQGRGSRGGSRLVGQGRDSGPSQNNNKGAAANRIPPITCIRCRSRDGSHTSDNCPSTAYCSKHKNWSHKETDCRGVYPRK